MTQSFLTNRLLKPGLAGCVAGWLISELPMSTVLRGSLAQLLSDLAEEHAIKGILIEEVGGDAPAKRLGMGLSAFIEPKLMDAYVAQPRAFAFMDVLERVARAERPILGPAQIARANGGDGLDLIVLYMQRGWDLKLPIWREVGEMGHQSYVEHHRGYNIRRALQEDWTNHKAIYLAAGYQELATVAVDPATLPSGFACSAPSRTLLYADCETVKLRAPGSSVSYVFQKREPRCFFTLAQQKLLEGALEGATDRELAESLDLSPTTIKHSWRDIYDRVLVNVPYVLPDGEAEDESKRGREKRRHVLAYVKDHPEEIRPLIRRGR